MDIVYNLFISLYGIGIKTASKFNHKAKLWIDGRNNWQEKLKKNINPNDKIIWIHCSSLGEFEQGRPVIEKIRTKFPTHKIALSFFSPSGYEIQKNYEGADYIFYLPLDTKSNAKTLIKILNPEILILVKYEYWYNILNSLNKKKIPIIVISALIRESHVFFKPYGGWFRNRIAKINHFFVQNTDSKKLLQAIRINQVTVAGDTRYDRVKEILQTNTSLPFIDNFKNGQKLIVAGSTWKDDEDILANFINHELPKDWKIVFAPHKINSKEIQKLKDKIQVPTAIYTQSQNEDLSQYQVLILDTIGILTKVYAHAEIAYVGGGFTKSGIHNTLEPATFGVPVIFGPNFHPYLEAIELLKTNAAKSFKNQFEFDELISKLISNPKERETMGQLAAQHIQDKPNSSNVILTYLHSILN